MNLDTLREKVRNQVKTVEAGGTEYHIAKIGAIDGFEVNRLLTALEMDGEGDDKKIKNQADLVRFHCLLLSKAIVDESGSKTLDSDEGRDLLSKLPSSEFLKLGDAAMEWNTGDAKKN